MSTDAGTRPAAGDGRPPPGPAPRRGLRDRTLGRILLLALVLLAALLVARTCGSQSQEVSQDEAIEIAQEAAGFTPCDAQGCVVVRIVPRGIPPRQFWLVGLAEAIEDGKQVRYQSFLIDAQTGEVTRA